MQGEMQRKKVRNDAEVFSQGDWVKAMPLTARGNIRCGKFNGAANNGFLLDIVSLKCLKDIRVEKHFLNSHKKKEKKSFFFVLKWQ